MQNRRQRRDRGAAAVEFGLIVPIFILFILGLVDIGMMFARGQMVNNAAREAVRMASLGATSEEINTAVQNSLDDSHSTVTVSVTCKKADGSSCGAFNSSAESGGTAMVTIRYIGPWLTPVGETWSDQMDLTRTSRMRIE